MKIGLIAAFAAAMFATPAMAQSTVTVETNPAAPTSNFGTPTNQATAGYTLSLNDTNGSLFGVITQTGGESAGAFANLYFDVNPTVGDGSDLGFELGANNGGSANAFIPGMNGSVALADALFDVTSATVNGLTTLNFRLDNSLFTQAIAGLNYYPDQTFESTQTLRLSQSLSYSVAGGASFGTNRLGSFSVGAVTAAVPEPATWAMMLFGFGAMGVSVRRRRRTNNLLQAA
jgi:PEP-CTERM motif